MGRPVWVKKGSGLVKRTYIITYITRGSKGEHRRRHGGHLVQIDELTATEWFISSINVTPSLLTDSHSHGGWSATLNWSLTTLLLCETGSHFPCGECSSRARCPSGAGDCRPYPPRHRAAGRRQWRGGLPAGEIAAPV